MLPSSPQRLFLQNPVAPHFLCFTYTLPGRETGLLVHGVFVFGFHSLAVHEYPPLLYLSDTKPQHFVPCVVVFVFVFQVAKKCDPPVCRVEWLLLVRAAAAGLHVTQEWRWHWHCRYPAHEYRLQAYKQPPRHRAVPVYFVHKMTPDADEHSVAQGPCSQLYNSSISCRKRVWLPPKSGTDARAQASWSC